jgi:hypothetical protein
MPANPCPLPFSNANVCSNARSKHQALRNHPLRQRNCRGRPFPSDSRHRRRAIRSGVRGVGVVPRCDRDDEVDDLRVLAVSHRLERVGKTHDQ